MLSTVTKHFEGDQGRQFTPGEIVDSTDWPKEAQLQRQRFIEPAPEGATVPNEDADGDVSDVVVGGAV